MGQKNCSALSYNGECQNPGSQSRIHRLTEEGSDICARCVNPNFVDSNFPHKRIDTHE